MHAWDMMVGGRFDTPSRPRTYHMGDTKQERMERWHRVQKDVNSQNGGGAGSNGEDKMDIWRQFFNQYVLTWVST